MGASPATNLGMFPVVQGGSSSLSVECTSTTASALADTVNLYEDYPSAQWHFGAGRYADIASTTTNTITTTAAGTGGFGHFTADDVNHGISGPGIPARAFIKSVTSTSVVTLNIGGVLAASFATPAFNQPPAGGFVKLLAGPMPAWVCYIANDEESACNIRITSGVNSGEYQVYSTAAGSTVLRNTGETGSSIPGTPFAAGGVAKPAYNDKKIIIENSDGRSFIDATTVHPAANAVACSATANFRADDVGRYISGGSVSYSLTPFTKITAVGGLGTNGCGGTQTSAITSSVQAANAGPLTLTVSAAGMPCNPLPGPNIVNLTCAGNVQKIDGAVPAGGQATYTTTTRAVKDATYSPGGAGSTMVCSATARFGRSDINLPVFNVSSPGIGAKVTAGNIPDNDWITTVNAAGTCATLNVPTNATAANANIVIGQPNAMAPAHDDPVVTNGTELSLNPALVAGQQACSSNVLQGFNIIGRWHNPGNFGTGAGTFAAAQLHSAVMGQFAFPTAVLVFNAYLMLAQAGAASGMRHQTNAHYEVVFPLIPTGAAVCPAPSTVGLGYEFHYGGFSPSQGQMPSGWGTPGTLALRGLSDRNTAVAGAILADEAFYSVAPATEIIDWTTHQFCPLTAAASFGFVCGHG